jgi:hypothetical protein
VTSGFVVSILGYVAWGGYIAFAAAQANARQRADPDPIPDSAGAYTMLLYLLFTPCVLLPFLVVGVILCANQRHRPFGIGMLSGFAAPLVIAVICRLLLSVYLRLL